MAVSELETLDTLLHSLYRGPLEQPLWQDFLRRLRDALAADYATLLLRPPKEGDQGVVLNAVIVSPDVYTAYNETWFALDPFVDLPADTVMTLGEFMDRDTLEASDYFREFMGPLGIGHMLGVDMRDDDGMEVRLRVTRGRDAVDFDADTRRRVARLVPHLKQAVALHRRIAATTTERDVYADAFDQLALGTVILDAHGEVLHTNRAAHAVMAEHPALRIRGGKLVVGEPGQDRAFRRLLQDMLEAHRRSEPSMVRVFRLASGESVAGLGLLIRPLPKADSPEGANPSVAIFFSDPLAPRGAPIHLLTQLFDLTPSEAQLALLLANGLTLDAAAEELGVSRNTVKTHLSAVFAKTGVNRQTQLVQLILKSVAPMG